MVTQMFKMVFTVVFVGAVFAVVPSPVQDWMEAKYDGFLNHFKKDTPDSQFIKKAERELKDFDGRFKDMNVAVGKLSDQVGMLKAEVEKEENALAGIVAELEDCKKKVTCGRLTSAETDSVRIRTERALHDIRMREQSITSKREQLAGVEKAWRDATKALEEARKTRDKMRTDLENLKTRLKAAGVRREANKAVAEAANPANSDELAKTMEELRERTRTAEREADFYGQEVRPAAPMPERDLRPLADQIDEALKRTRAEKRN